LIDGMLRHGPVINLSLVLVLVITICAAAGYALPFAPSSTHSGSSRALSATSPTQSADSSSAPTPTNTPPLPYPEFPDANTLLKQSLASHVLTILYTLFVGTQLAFLSQKFEKVTLGNIASIPLSGLVWIALLNNDMESMPSQPSVNAMKTTSNSGLGFPSIGLILPIHAFGICLSILALRIKGFRQAFMGIMAGSGGLFLALTLVLLREGLLIPLYFPNWILIIAGMAISEAVCIWSKSLIMIASPTLTGAFFIGLGIDIIVHRDGGALVGLKILFDHKLSTDLYQPEESTQLIMGLSMLLGILMIYIHHQFGPRNPWPWTERHHQHSKHNVQRYTYLTFSQLARSHSDMDSDIVPRRPKSVYHRVKKRDISVPLPYFPPRSHFSRESSEFSHFDSQIR